jgi:protein gp37
VRECPALTFQILTKRIDNVMKMLPPDWKHPVYCNVQNNVYKHVWLGISVVN